MEDKYFQTTNFYLSAYLFAKNCELVNIDKLDNSNKATFIFVNSPELLGLVDIFNFGKENNPETLIDVRKTIFAIKKLKDLLYSR